jgi:hypothetical protein
MSMLLRAEGLCCDNAGKTSQSYKIGMCTGLATCKTFPLFVVIYEGMQQSVQANIRDFFLSFNNWRLKKSSVILIGRFN